MALPNIQNNDEEAQGGFIIKDKTGRLRKMKHDGQVVDLQPAHVLEDKKVADVDVVERFSKPVAPPLHLGRPEPSAPLTPKPPISASPKAAYYFAPEDEEEILKHAESLKELTEKSSLTAAGSLASAVQKIVTQTGVHFDEDVMNKRFGKVIESFFHEVRTPIETEEVLTRPQKIGGLALPSETAKKVVDSVVREAVVLRQAGVIGKEAMAAKPPLAVVQELSEPGMIAPPPPEFIPRPQPKPPLPPPVFPKPAEKKVTIEPTPDADNLARIAYTRQVEPSRPQMVDIRQPAKVLGPAEELGEIDLKEFRRLGASPTAAANKILEKIGLLQEESWAMRWDGIKLWRQSETNQLYLAIGRESLETGKRVKEIIEKRLQEHQSSLTNEEFLAINTLNSQLAA